jgi:hypothetical protein
MSQVRNYFSSTTTPINLRGTLGAFIGITSGTIQLSASFGGYYFPAT